MNKKLIHEDLLIDGRVPTFWDYFLDMHTPLEHLKLRNPKTGQARVEQENRMLKSYFDEAFKTLDIELKNNGR